MAGPERHPIATVPRQLAAGRQAAGLIDDAEELLQSLGDDKEPETCSALLNLQLAMSALKRADERLRNRATRPQET